MYIHVKICSNLCKYSKINKNQLKSMGNGWEYPTYVLQDGAFLARALRARRVPRGPKGRKGLGPPTIGPTGA